MRESTVMKWAGHCLEALCWGALVGAILFALASCAIPAKSAEHPHPIRETVTRFVTCMVTPPPVEAIDWPTPDTIGNFVMHESTAQRIKNAYAALVKYSRDQYYRCLHAADEQGEQSVAVEVDDAGVAP